MPDNRILQQLDDYIDYKHSLGFKLKHEESVLRNFVKYTLSIDYDGPITLEIVLKWVSSGRQSNKTMGRKIEVIRPFSKYVASFDNKAEAIHNLMYKNVHARPTPYIYVEDEIIKLMSECQNLYSPDGIRAISIKTVIGLLWATGLRPSEPTNLNNADVDLDNLVLHIKQTKFSKERYVTFDNSVKCKLHEYKIEIEQKLGIKTPEDPFFYTTGGKPLTERALAYAFKLIRSCISAQPIGYPYVRLYDFRHTMACNTIKCWTEQRIDVNENLYVLSTYMGHVKPQDTYWYLTATPEMLELCCSRYENMFGGDEADEF
jgi:integrase/recombinase XerD